MINRLWILGAADPEMAAIEELLRDCGESVAYAVGPDGERVHPGNAYRPDRVSDDCPVASLDPGDVVYEVECALRPRIAGVDHITIDHHRPGDPGYGRPPAEFLPASSIGQVIAELAWLGRLPDSWRPYGPGSRIEPGTVEWSEPDPEDADQRAYWSVCDSDGYWCEIPADIILAAAADHCLESAYRGRCPGVDPDALMRWRIASRAAHQGRTEEEVLADVEAARTRLRETARYWACDEEGVAVAPTDYPDYGPTTIAPLADLRGESIPELPEAAAREGIPYLATVCDRDGREKVVLQCAPPELVERFLAGEIVPGLVGGYPAASAVQNKGA